MGRQLRKVRCSGHLTSAEAGGARRILNDYSLTCAPQLKRGPLGGYLEGVRTLGLRIVGFLPLAWG
jgi:hypothetical protein